MAVRTTNIWIQHLDNTKDIMPKAIYKSKRVVDNDHKHVYLTFDQDDKVDDRLDKNNMKNAADSKDNSLAISDKVINAMRKTDKIMKEMKNSNDEIFLENSKYLKKNAKKYLQSIPKSLNNNFVIAENEAEDDNTHLEPNLNNQNKPRPRTEASQNENFGQIKNYKYINSRLRSELTRAFLKYNPSIHHHYVTKLGEQNPEIKRDYEMKNEYLDEDLKEVLDPHYYQKKYEKLVKKNREPYSRQETELNDKNLIENSMRNRIMSETTRDGGDFSKTTTNFNQTRYFGAKGKKKIEDNTVSGINTTENDALTTKAQTHMNQTKYIETRPREKSLPIYANAKKTGNLAAKRVHNKTDKKRKKIRENEVNVLKEECLPGIFSAIQPDIIGKYINDVTFNETKSKMNFGDQYAEYFPGMVKADLNLKSLYNEKFTQKNTSYDTNEVHNITYKTNIEIIDGIRKLKEKINKISQNNA